MIRILSESSHIALEEKINALLVDHSNVKVVHLSVHPMHDMYQGQAPPTVCNSWNEYLAAVEIP